MTLVNIEYQSLDEVVFENRNKSYGAYLLRKTYSQHVNAAIFITGGICALLIGIPSINGWLDNQLPAVPIVQEPTICTLPPPEIITELQIPKRPAVQASTAANLTPEVTEEVVTDPPKPEVAELAPIVDGVDTGLPSSLDIGSPGGTSEGTPTLSLPAVEDNAAKGPLDFAEEMPEFPGGSAQLIKYLSKKLHYPRIAQQTETQGKVFVQFVVNRDGKITDVTVIKGVSKECDEEAIRVVQSMPNWKPGKQNGRAVSVKYVFPIVFKMGG